MLEGGTVKEAANPCVSMSVGRSACTYACLCMYACMQLLRCIHMPLLVRPISVSGSWDVQERIFRG